MNKLNALGSTILECKMEYLNAHSVLVKNALRIYAQDLATTTAMDTSILTVLQDDSMTTEDFEKFLLEKDQCCISLEEILEEFEEKKESFIQVFEQGTPVTCTICENSQTILFSMPLSIGEEFVANYFGVEQNETFNLMQRQGFIEKFTALRIRKLAQDIIAVTSNRKPIYIGLDTSYAYYVEEQNLYAVDITVSITAEHIFEKETENIEFIKYVQEAVGVSQKNYLSY